jgi:hypothetical protein
VRQPEDPPGFVVRTESQKAASSNGFRLERGIDNGWLRFASTTSQVGVWIAGASKDGPWFLCVDRPEVGAECGLPIASDLKSPTVAAFSFDSLQGLYDAIERIYRLGVSLPDAPLRAYRAAVDELPRKTEAERLIVQRVGQEIFRGALLAYWGGRCPLTGITDVQLLRASHIVPWAECETDEKRLDVHNGLLLSALWDAAFDAGLVSFTDEGDVVYSSRLKETAIAALGSTSVGKLEALTKFHCNNLAWHRSRHAFV